MAKAKTEEEKQVKNEEAVTTEEAVQKVADPGEELMTIFVPKDTRIRNEPAREISVNGDSITVTPGQEATIKRKFAEVILHAMEADDTAANYITKARVD